MKTIFYCNYDFSAYGFQFVSVDFKERTVNRVTHQDTDVFPGEIYTYFTKAGFRILSGYTKEGKGFFLIKELKHFDESKKKGDQGHQQYYNLAFIADENHSDQDVFAFAAFALGNYQGFISAIASMFIIKPELHEGYTIDISKLEDFIATAVKTTITKNQFEEITKQSNNKFRFAVLFDDWNYALKMFEMPVSTSLPDTLLTIEEFERLVEQQSVKSGIDTIVDGTSDKEKVIEELQNKNCSLENDKKKLQTDNKQLQDKNNGLEKEVDTLKNKLAINKKHLLYAAIGGVIIGILTGLLFKG
jgi:FtsZ-binding cell division protein ZapB